MDLRNFLKKFSTLNNDFIDDFYNIYDIDKNNINDYPINIEIIAKWLNTKKGDLKETLLNTYTKNIDYKISKEKEKKISKSNKENIMLTSECFKRLCLLSKTKKAEEVRTYFLELEKIINNYKDYIIDGLKNTIKILENNQKEVTQKIKGTVYIIRSLKDINSIYRFGQTDDFKKRLSNYNSSNSDKMEIMYIYETKDSKKIQDCVIAQIKPYRYKKRKDFYEIDINIIKNIIKDCAELTQKYKKSLTKINKTNQEGGNLKYNLFLYIKY
jgi:phage anti-repressor protein